MLIVGVVQGSQRPQYGFHSSIGLMYMPLGCNRLRIPCLIFSLSAVVVVAFKFKLRFSFCDLTLSCAIFPYPSFEKRCSKSHFVDSIFPNLQDSLSCVKHSERSSASVSFSPA